MRARDLAGPYVSVSTDSGAADAAWLLATESTPGLVVVDTDAEPCAILTTDQLLEFLVPAYVRNNHTLAAVIDESHADTLAAALTGRQVSDCLGQCSPLLPAVPSDATTVEIAELMASVRSPLVVVLDDHHGARRLYGVITANQLLRHLLTSTDRV